MSKVGFSASIVTLVPAGVWGALVVGVDPSFDGESVPWPWAPWVDRVEVEFSNPGGVAGRTVDCLLTHDQAGVYPATRQRQEPVILAPSSGPNNASAIFSIEGFIPHNNRTFDDRIVVWVLVSGAGNCTMIARIYFDAEPS